MIAKLHHIHDVEFDIIFHLTHNHRFVAHMGKVLFAT